MSTEVREGYKVLRPRNKQLGSVVRFTGCKTRYRKGHVTKRKDGCGPLGVFNNLHDAMDFAGTFSTCMTGKIKLVIYEVEYTPSQDHMFWFLHRRWNDTNPFRICNLGILKVPEGTDFAEEVKVIKKVKL